MKPPPDLQSSRRLLYQRSTDRLPIDCRPGVILFRSQIRRTSTSCHRQGRDVARHRQLDHSRSSHTQRRLTGSSSPLDSLVIPSCVLLTVDRLALLQVGVVRVRGCFGSLRSSDHDAALDRVLSPSPVLKAPAPPPGTSVIGTLSFARVGLGSFPVSFEFSQSSYGCGLPRPWTSAVVVSSRSNGTWEGRSIGHRLENFPDVTLGQLLLLVLLVISKIRIITFSCIVVVS